jgi:hypothetical protein
MHYNEIHIKNPITAKSINQLIDDIKSGDTSKLIINIGEHNFESIQVMKELKEKLSAELKYQSRIKKIAFITPPGIMNKSDDENRYRYFYSKEEAVEWIKL